MARFGVCLGQCSFCGVSAGRASRLVGDPGRPERICRACTVLVTELPDSLPPLDELPEPRVEAPDPDPEPADVRQRTAGEVLLEFRRGVEQQIGARDCDARRDLGIAYFEMGLLDEAIQEWEIASADAAYRAESLALMSRALRERGDVDRSIECLTAALKTAGNSQQQNAAFFFELSLSLDAADEPGKAAQARAQARTIDPTYADREPAPLDPRFFRNAREAFATGGSRDAFRRPETPARPMRPAAVIAALEAWLRSHPEGVRERVTLADRLLGIGRRTEGAHHFLIAGETLRDAGDPVHAMGSFQRCAEAASPSASPAARRALAELHGEERPAEPVLPEELERFRCSFCDGPADFHRPPVRADETVICADCLAAVRRCFSD